MSVPPRWPSAWQRLSLRWILGLVLSTLIIALTSPLFVRSYLPLRPDPIRGVWTLPPATTYRWRSEGYADTSIGPHGMPGKTRINPPDAPSIRVALWGDSQAEGVSVADAEKIFAQAERLSGDSIEVFPLARSGEDGADWVTQMPRAESLLAIDVHVWLVVDLPDLLASADAPVPPPSVADVAQANAAIASRLPAFIIQAARNVLTVDGSSPRTLRFSVGPISSRSNRPSPEQSLAPEPVGFADWTAPLDAVDRASKVPVVIVYAPKVPQIIGGKIAGEPEQDEAWIRLRSTAARYPIKLVNLTEPFRASADEGRWPHGFHNGQIGVGHLNRHGNRIVARSIVDAIFDAIDSAAASDPN